MARREKKCCICDKRITAQFWVCKDCEKQHGLADASSGKQKRPSEWPEWARDLYNQAQREYYRVHTKGEGAAFQYDDETGGLANADPLDEFDDSEG